MKPWIWLRAASGLQALGTVLHNLATLSTKPTHGPKEQAVFDTMRGFQFNMMGSIFRQIRTLPAEGDCGVAVGLSALQQTALRGIAETPGRRGSAAAFLMIVAAPGWISRSCLRLIV